MHGHRTRPGIFFLWNVIHSSMLLLRVLESRPENADANGRLTRRGSTATLSLPRACHRSRPGASADPPPHPQPATARLTAWDAITCVRVVIGGPRKLHRRHGGRTGMLTVTAVRKYELKSTASRGKKLSLLATSGCFA